MTAPRRLQRRRARGWRMPPFAIYVGRPSRWANPFPVAVGAQPAGETIGQTMSRLLNAHDAAKRLYFAWLDGRPDVVVADRRPPTHDEIRCDLAGHDLVCWCPPHLPCHADILLQIANGDPDA